MTIYFITGNQHKLAEIQAVLPQVEQLDVDLPELQEISPDVIIRAKLQEAFKYHQGPCMVEDTGLYLECLWSLPWPLIKRFIKGMGTQGLAELAQKYENRKAQAKTYIGYAESPEDIHIFEGSIEGEIVLPRKGSAFGWDPIFQPFWSQKTFAEMTSEEKNAISMRRKAVEALKTFLAKK